MAEILSFHKLLCALQSLGNAVVLFLRTGSTWRGC